MSKTQPNNSDLRQRIEEMPVTIHFKENSIPGLRRGIMTKESAEAVIQAFIESLPEKIKRPDGTPLFGMELIPMDYRNGYNQALTDVTDMLADDSDKQTKDTPRRPERL